MTTLDISTSSYELAKSIAVIEAELSWTIATEGETSVPACIVGLEKQLAKSDASRARLIAVVRSLRNAAVGDTSRSAGRSSKLVAPLTVPDRITKRDYNYFNDLNTALENLLGQAP